MIRDLDKNKDISRSVDLAKKIGSGCIHHHDETYEVLIRIIFADAGYSGKCGWKKGYLEENFMGYGKDIPG